MSVPPIVGLYLIPRGSHADQPRESSVLPPPEEDKSGRTPEDAPPGRLSRSQHRCAATLRSDPPPGSLSPALTHLVHPSQLSGVSQRYFGCGSPWGLHPRLKNVTGR